MASKASLYSLATSGSELAARELRHILPAVAAAREFLAAVLHPDDVHPGTAGLVHEGGDGRDDVVAAVGLSDDADLHIDDEQCRVGAVDERGHDASRILAVPACPL